MSVASEIAKLESRWSPLADCYRHSVIHYLHWGHDGRKELTEAEWLEIYLLGDGFGKIGPGFASEICYDWSHVRDSSPEAIAEMYGKLIEILKAKGGLK